MIILYDNFNNGNDVYALSAYKISVLLIELPIIF